eukprot:6203351-Pleurochrysis_carterae.AAC.7
MAGTYSTLLVVGDNDVVHKLILEISLASMCGAFQAPAILSGHTTQATASEICMIKIYGEMCTRWEAED